ncbi:hypothetical protein AALP_AA2G114100 [Arabis alpina]|uniref:Peptidase A1 domain-containing protein n=1 Tax=Arabis alpina TaxID=50452 RepID=A0A087HGR2_ARAAL|nr:hypothetical protein AALP_AA2G114100 [Arabis alpina]
MAPRTYGGLAFIAEVYLGSPSIRQYLHVDTGSNLTWTQCFPSSHSFVDHIYPKYSPEDSNTYFDAECETTAKNSTPKFTYYASTGVCSYELTYGDGNLIRGRLAEEMITLQTRNGEFKVVYDVYFGCNDQAVGNQYIGTGILGLGTGKFSIVEKLGSKFSICFGLIMESKPTHNLILGDGANIQGHPTVINTTQGNYMIMLEFILVGAELKALDDPVQVHLDTGTTICHLSGFLFNFIV